MFDEDFKEEEINVPELVEKLKEASHAYYNLSEPVMSDEEFDNLKDLLKKIDPKNRFLFEVGSEVGVTEWKKEKHKIPMGSLNKVNTVEEFKTWVRDVECNDFVMTTKLDGISIALNYEKGKLIRAITRGDGIIGEDILSNVIQMKNVKSFIKGFTGSLRGEIVIHRDDFVKLNIESESNGDRIYKNPRNAASGISKSLNGTYAKYCSILYYDVVSNTDYEFEIRKSDHILDLGLEICWTCEVDTVCLIDEYKKWEEKLREEYPYEIDGLVIAVNDLEKQQDLGFVYDNLKGKVAWKFGSIEKIAKVLDVTWECGLNRRITPVIHIEPTKIGGVEVTKMTCHNLEIFKSLGIYRDCKLLFKRANDVVPNPIRVVEE